ncbi:hypothetical protein GALMADRAFT_508187 [Galerina marginata CBS 339.88]|uniref:Uncharacterized protein n=1 Tax=Galerina marginata (strain CBS 339.88) TaxID=685588 RepID=A0A067T9Z2_GALM3|nr:hypothetical protein GALMADRAFT_508187 [Galerina marginata CBS 339.88]
MLLGRNREAFKDPEPECVIRINPKQKGMQIGRANDRSSYFAISLWIEPRESPCKIFFGLDFMPDPVVKERFQSASFHVTFGHDDPEGQHPPLKILDISSNCIGEDRDGEESSISTFSVSSDNISNETITTDTDVIGQGLHSPTAVWSLTEDASKTIKRGLDGHYRVSVRLPTTSRVWIKYYGKAVLVGGGIGPWRRVTLQSGSVEAPYRRILDLSEVVEGGM